MLSSEGSQCTGCFSRFCTSCLALSCSPQLLKCQTQQCTTNMQSTLQPSSALFFPSYFFLLFKTKKWKEKKKKRQYHTKTGTCEDVFAQYDPTCFPETVSKVKRTDPRIDMISLSQQDVLSNNSLLLCNVCSILVTVIYYLDFCHIRALSDRIFIFIF